MTLFIYDTTTPATVRLSTTAPDFSFETNGHLLSDEVMIESAGSQMRYLLGDSLRSTLRARPMDETAGLAGGLLRI